MFGDGIPPPRGKQLDIVNLSSQQIAPEPSPPPPGPQPMRTGATASLDSMALQPIASLVVKRTLPESVLSPNKRRDSPSLNIPPAAASESTGQRETVSQIPKPSKPDDEPPPRILPQRYELFAAEDIVDLIAHMLVELIARNDTIRTSNRGLTRFHSRTAPGISVRDYLHRLVKHAMLTPPLLLAMVYYIDRLCALYQGFSLNTLTVHRFLITAAAVAAKGLSDSIWNNKTYARVGGVRVAELTLLELEFLYRVDWKIVPDPEILVAYYHGLVLRTPGYTLESEGSSEDDEERNGE